MSLSNLGLDAFETIAELGCFIKNYEKKISNDSGRSDQARSLDRNKNDGLLSEGGEPIKNDFV